MYSYWLNYNNCPHYFKPVLELTIYFNNSGIIFDVDIECYKEDFEFLLNNGQPFIIYGCNEEHLQLKLINNELIITHIPENMLEAWKRNDDNLKINTYDTTHKSLLRTWESTDIAVCSYPFTDDDKEQLLKILSHKNIKVGELLKF